MKENASSMSEETLAARLQEIGFSCTRCGECCRAGDGDDNLVMVSRAEVRRISAHCRLDAAEVAEPYPESVELPGGRRITFGWAIRRTSGDCMFYEGGSCRAYAARPWICRTYPFMLDGDTLLTFPCPGLGSPTGPEEARALARDLLARRAAEQEQEERIRRAFSMLPQGKGRLVVDGEGVKGV